MESLDIGLYPAGLPSSILAVEACITSNGVIDERVIMGNREPYPGGKGNVFREIINLMPPHRVYIEAFLGGGAVMRNKRPARFNIGIERNKSVILETASEIAPHAPIEWTTGVKLPEQGLKTTTIIVDDKPQSWRFINGDCVQWLASFPFKGDELVYFDPPYVRSSRKSAAPLYAFELDDDQHINLLHLAMHLPCKVMISGYHSDLYDQMLAGWHSHEFQAVTRGGSMATEVVWFNYPRPVELHDYQWIGANFRERDRIKKKMRRWTAKLHNMSETDRAAILWAMQEAGFTAAAPEAALSAVPGGITIPDVVDVAPLPAPEVRRVVSITAGTPTYS